MIEETVTVVAIDGARAWIESAPKSACSSCAQKAGCSTSVLGQFVKERRVEVDNPLPELQVGDRIVVGINEKTVILGSLILYLFPLIALFFGAVTGQFIFADSIGEEFSAIIGGAIGITGAILYIRNTESRFLQQHKVRPVVIKKA